jgi:peptidoglycan/xylan/chitin deacetylase (PgdA/CDA1 family)
MSRREHVAHLLERSGALAAILKIRARASIPWLTILTYHRFPSKGRVEPFDDGVIDVTPEEFERHVVSVKRYFHIVGVAELSAYAEGRSLPKNPVAIAFDDGYLDSYDIALPILKKHDCKAMFFVATSLATERRVHWWDRIAYVMKTSPRRELRLEYPRAVCLDLTGPRNSAIRAVLRLVKFHPSLHWPTFLSELSRAAGVPWSPELDRKLADRLLMTWDHIRALQKAGMDVQSHTRTHRVLQTLPDVELRDELEGSRDDLRRELGAPARAVAYPAGYPVDRVSPVRAALEEAGYEIGLTNGTGPTPLRGEIDRFDIRRQTVERGFSDALLLTILALPRLAPKHPWHLLPNVVTEQTGRRALGPCVDWGIVSPGNPDGKRLDDAPAFSASLEREIDVIRGMRIATCLSNGASYEQRTDIEPNALDESGAHNRDDQSTPSRNERGRRARARAHSA